MAFTPACQGYPALSTTKSEALDIVFGKKVLRQKENPKFKLLLTLFLVFTRITDRDWR